MTTAEKIKRDERVFLQTELGAKYQTTLKDKATAFGLSALDTKHLVIVELAAFRLGFKELASQITSNEAAIVAEATIFHNYSSTYRSQIASLADSLGVTAAWARRRFLLDIITTIAGYSLGNLGETDDVHSQQKGPGGNR